ncbi:MAG: imidazolonepropionase-like domain-containing protein, partial [Microthrixaceae bacterium]
MEPSRPAAPTTAHSTTTPTGARSAAAHSTAAGSDGTPVDLVLRAEWVLTVDGDDRVLHDGAVAIAGECIAEVGPAEQIVAAHPNAPVVALDSHV